MTKFKLSYNIVCLVCIFFFSLKYNIKSTNIPTLKNNYGQNAPFFLVNENALQTGLIDRKDSNKTQTSSSPKSSPLNSMGT